MQGAGYTECAYVQGTDFKNASMHGLLWLHTVASYTFDLNPGHERQVSEVISFHFAFKHTSTPEAYMFANAHLLDWMTTPNVLFEYSLLPSQEETLITEVYESNCLHNIQKGLSHALVAHSIFNESDVLFWACLRTTPVVLFLLFISHKHFDMSQCTILTFLL